MFQFNNGDRARDRVTKLQGIITSRADHLSGCNRYWITPEELHDGKPVEGMWIDEDMLEVVKTQVHVPIIRFGAPVNEPERLRKTGGANLPPSRSSIGKR